MPLDFSLKARSRKHCAFLPVKRKFFRQTQPCVRIQPSPPPSLTVSALCAIGLEIRDFGPGTRGIRAVDRSPAPNENGWRRQRGSFSLAHPAVVEFVRSQLNHSDHTPERQLPIRKNSAPPRFLQASNASVGVFRRDLKLRSVDCRGDPRADLAQRRHQFTNPGIRRQINRSVFVPHYGPIVFLG